ncbi:Anthranilate synthase, aminase component, partial [hydrothermal vent metagenome]
MAGSFGIDTARDALNNSKPALVWRKKVADTETPVSAALKLMVAERGDFLLESVEGGETRGRHSLIGLAPDLVFRANGKQAEINRNWLAEREEFVAQSDDSMNALRSLVKSCQMDVPQELPRALACLVGYFGYETIGLVEKLPRAPQSDLDLPDMLFTRPTVILIFDRLADELFLIAPVWPETNGDAEYKIASAEERLDEVERELSLPAPANPGSIETSLPNIGQT